MGEAIWLVILGAALVMLAAIGCELARLNEPLKETKELAEREFSMPSLFDFGMEMEAA